MGNCLRGFFLPNRSGSSNQHMVHSPDWRNSAARQWYLENDPILHPTPGVSIPVSQLTEDQQIEIALRLGLISSLPLFIFDESQREKLTECIICMCDYELGDELRYLPCLHTYHRICIDDWLMRSSTCPSCLEELHPQGISSASSLRHRFSSASASIKSDLNSSTRFNASSLLRMSSRSRDKYLQQRCLSKKSSSRDLDYVSSKQQNVMKPDPSVLANSTSSSVLSSSSGTDNTTSSSAVVLPRSFIFEDISPTFGTSASSTADFPASKNNRISSLDSPTDFPNLIDLSPPPPSAPTTKD